MTTYLNYLIPTIFIVLLFVYAKRKHVPLLVTARRGAEEGVQTVWRLLPYFLLMLLSIGMLRASGLLTDLAQLSAPYLQKIGMPSSVLPLAIMRPFSGGASNAILIDLIHQYGVNSLTVLIASTMIASTETTFYVVTMYFGAIYIKRSRYAIPVGLLSDLCGMLAAIWIANKVFSAL